MANGYDVFGGGATQDADGTHVNGITGGFVGYNHEGKISKSTMVLCDTVRGTEKLVGPFTGYNDLKSVYWFNDIASIEGEGNQYSIYRPADDELNKITVGESPISVTLTRENIGGTSYNRYTIDHINSFQNVLDTGKELQIYDLFKALDGAVETSVVDETRQRELNAYISDSKAVLMRDADSPDNPPTTVPEPGENADPCSERVDLTIQKIWDDWFNLGGARPAEITITIYRQKFDENGTSLSDKEFYKEVTLTTEHSAGTWSAVWRTILENARLYEYTDVNNNGVLDNGDTILAYYVYTAEEKVVPPGYTVSYDTYDPGHAGDYELTITNKLAIRLPDTGGIGDGLFVVVGVGIVLLALTMRKRRKGQKEVRWTYHAGS